MNVNLGDIVAGGSHIYVLITWIASFGNIELK